MRASIDHVFRAAVRLHQQGRAGDADRGYDLVLKQLPEHPGALHLKGVLALQAGRYDEAIDLIERSLAIAPKQALPLSNLGVAYRAVERYDDAIAVLRQAVELAPDSVDALANLGQMLVRAGLVREALSFNRRALAIDPSRLGLQSSALFAENYVAEIDPAETVERARKVGALIAAANPERRGHFNDPDPDRRLKVGLVSGDFRSHPVGRFLLGLVREIDPTKLELFAYANSTKDDAVTVTLQQSVPNWLNITDMPDAVFAARVIADQIDVLVDLSGHTASHRLMVFARKPAPVSLTWLGYFATTGLSAIDYVLANQWVVPPSEEYQFVERIWRMPDTYLCFAAPADPPELGPLPALANGHVTFGCFNHFNKLSDHTLAAWRALMELVPESRLILRSSGHYHDGVIGNLETQLSAAGVDLNRVRIDGKITDYAEHLRSYDEIDIALDPFPYNGGTTTVEALYMGVPVLARAGDRYVAHMGESILHNAGLPEWIAPDEATYPVLGAGMAGDFTALAALRASLRQRMLASPLFDAPRFARNFEHAVRGMWQAWCATHRRI